MDLERDIFEQEFAATTQTQLVKSQHTIRDPGGGRKSGIISFPLMKNALYLCLALLAILAWRDWSRREIVHDPGVLVPSTPRQQNLENGERFAHGEYQLTRRAAFDVEARVLSRKNYWFGRESDLSPLDLALGWGVMSDQAVLDRIEITQGARWYFTRYENPAPVPDREIIANSGNMHLIPANDRVRGNLKKVRRGDIVRLKGTLVDVDGDSGFYWRTSLSRDDTGNGSCEIFFVEEANIR